MTQLLLPGRESHSPTAWLRTILFYRPAFLSRDGYQPQAQNDIRAKRLAGTGINEGRSIAVDRTGNVYTTGLTTVLLILMGTGTFAQLPNPTVAYQPVSSWTRLDNSELTSSTSQSAEYTPLNNLPFFPGGQQALQTYLRDPRRYPHQARICQLEGTVQVQFRVMPNGYLAEIRVVRSSEPLLDQAALLAVTEMPRWYPAHRAGVAVSSLYVLPVTFRLD